MVRYNEDLASSYRIMVEMARDIGGFSLVGYGVRQIESKFIFFEKCENWSCLYFLYDICLYCLKYDGMICFKPLSSFIYAGRSASVVGRF